MTLALLLPGCPATLPVPDSEYQPLPCPDLPDITDLPALQQSIAALHGQVGYLFGSDSTPTLIWLLAIQKFPSAKRHYFCSQQQAWRELAKLRPERSSAPADTQYRVQTGFSDRADGQLIGDAFRWAAWGYLQDSNRRKLQEIEEEAYQRSAANRTLPLRIADARQLGERAFHLTEELRERLASRQPDIEGWIAEVSAGAHRNLAHHLNHELEKWHKRQVNQQQRNTTGRRFHSEMPAVALRDGRHPNSLRHLPAAPRWQIMIDETGLRFDADADRLNTHDKELGRLVALAIPEGQQLPPLPGFHAADAPASEVDHVLHRVLERPLGIFGFTVQDPALQSIGWIAHIQQLLRWVLLQLPVEPGQPLRVDAQIERRSDYQHSQTLQIMGEVLESQCKRLDPQRFAGLQLSLSFIDKQHPLVGYVDAIAYTWGSPAAESADRLKKSALLGHCLLRPSDRALERLYLALNAQHRLPGNDWYALCAATLEESEGGLLASFLKRLGERAQQQLPLWQGYLGEVRQRLHSKDFRLAELGQALAWLDRWAPGGESLPASLRLPLETARLAADNHRGQVNQARIAACLTLSQQLHDEDAPEACSAILRLAATTTNTFEFDTLTAVIRQWLAEPVAVPGLLNHAKLHSTLGQLCAFGGQPEQAGEHFERALECLARLCDPAQAAREMAQTTSYRLTAAMDTPNAAPQALLDTLRQHLGRQIGKQTEAEISRSLAYSGQAARYDHHLWLRALVTFPQTMAAARQDYLGQQHQWQHGKDHPWPLIEAYRGWLLRDADQPEQATERLQAAIDACAAEGNGPTLQWMAEVLRTLAAALGLSCVECCSAEAREQLCHSLPHAPHAQLERFAGAGIMEHGAILAALRQCLPFNFH
ncbi:hypothetical protein [Azotobacter salinestris]|uniref:hypothetical protein n=1 Tax=Azotobacter salinestris TaxID=69964 RepID=UPI0032DF8802